MVADKVVICIACFRLVLQAESATQWVTLVSEVSVKLLVRPALSL